MRQTSASSESGFPIRKCKRQNSRTIFIASREANREGGSYIEFAFDMYFAPGLFNQTIDGGQS